MSLWTIVGIILLAGVFVWIIRSAPFVAEPYKDWATWIIAVVVVLYLIWIIFGPFPDVRIPSRHG